MQLYATCFASSSTTAENSINDDWQSFRSAAYTAAAESLGHPRRANADWFAYNDPAIETLLRDNRAALQERLSNSQSQTAIQHHAQTKSKLQRELRHIENSWWDAKADEVQALFYRGDSRGRWNEYYATLLNRPSEINDQILQSIQQCPIRDELDEFPTKREIEQAFHYKQ